MRRPPNKYQYSTDIFAITNRHDITNILNDKYSDPEEKDVVSVNIFLNGNEYSVMIVSRKLINKK